MHRRIRQRVCTFILALTAVLTLSGCYETKYQVFGREDGVTVAGLEGRYRFEDNGAISYVGVARTDSGNDYRFRAITPDEPERQLGVFRAIRISADLYIAHLRRAVVSGTPKAVPITDSSICSSVSSETASIL
jgi:hypothetical protein